MRPRQFIPTLCVLIWVGITLIGGKEFGIDFQIVSMIIGIPIFLVLYFPVMRLLEDEEEK